jgi:predicted P-loop ATPase
MRHSKDLNDPVSRLLLDANGNPIPHLANCITVLSPLESFFAYNDLKHSTVLVAAPPWHRPEEAGETIPVWGDHQITQAQLWVQNKGLGVSIDTTARALEMLARRRTFNPLKDYLMALKWDGEGRNDTWLSVFLNAEDSDYTRAVGGRFLIGAVARALDPGCKMDYMLVLEGGQGEHKSTVAQVLGGDFYLDGVGSDGKLDRDAILAMSGYWIVELAEVDEALRHNNAPRMKAFLSRQVDSYRPPYGRCMLRAKRQCVFIGTTNCHVYLHDRAGNRRYLPVRVWTKPGRVREVKSLGRVRDQLWAEAVVRYKAEERYWFEGEAETETLEEQQEARSIPHIADQYIEEYCRESWGWRSPVTVPDIFNYLVTPISRQYLVQQGNLMVQIPLKLRMLGYIPGTQRRDPNRPCGPDGRRSRVVPWERP